MSGPDRPATRIPPREAPYATAADASTRPTAGDRPSAPSPARWLTLVLLLLLVVVATGALGLWAAREAVERGYAAELETIYPRVSLLPGEPDPIAPERRIHVFYVSRGRLLVPHVPRLERAVTGQERLARLSEELLNPPSRLMRSPLPPGTRLLGVYLYEGVVWVDLSREFLEPPARTPLGEKLAVYGLVNTYMLNDFTLEGVRILVEGEPVTTAWGWLDLSSPLGPDLSLVEGSAGLGGPIDRL